MLIAEFQDFMNRDLTVDYVVYTNIAGFTMMMTSATIRMHYACINKCARIAQKCVRINSLII